MERPVERAQWLDRLRGVAAVGMVVVHVTHAVLREDLRATPGFRVVDAAFGLVAPTFLFCVGASFALRPAGPLGPRVLRAAGLFALGYAMHASGLIGYVRSGAPAELALFMQADILQVIAFALLLLAVTARAAPATWPWITVLLGGLAVLAGPFVADAGQRAPLVIAPYLTYAVATQFPLFPWLGHALLAAGGTQLRAQRGGLFWLAGIAALVSFVLFFAPLPTHDPYRTGPAYAVARFGVVALLGGALAHARLPARIDAVLALLGRRPLFLYVVHVALVYGRHPLSLRTRIGPELGVLGVAFAACLTLVAMTLLTWRWDSAMQARRTSRMVPTGPSDGGGAP